MKQEEKASIRFVMRLEIHDLNFPAPLRCSPPIVRMNLMPAYVIKCVNICMLLVTQ